MTADRAAALADAIVVAAGTSARMGGLDKLAAPIAGRPLLAWTLDALAGARVVGRLVVVTAPERIDSLRDAPWLPSSVVAVVPGGDRRQASVAAGLAELDRLDRARGGPADDRVVLVHDGARPLVSPALVEAVAEAAAAHGAAIPVVPIGETVKRIEDARVAATLDRTSLATAQTPQGVRRSILRAAFERFAASGPDTFTDEAALLEACSIPVHVIDGDPGNVKVTLPADLARAEAVLGTTSSTVRTGIGHDSHPFGPGMPLVLGGVRFDGAPRLHGHSDGDVAIHAICDALLGAAGLGDLGRLFPAGPDTPAGIASRTLLDEVLRQVAGAGWRPASLDLTIVAARPKLGPRLDAMRDAIASALGLDVARVNVKASTGNLDGMEGAGRGISALALAVVESAR
jgi:2-C-methyl-D-erythritol 4-phosphate cytidylyltransferase/2-C-methyl-D-erythritol 2,4-cyclodiphosphate synthase